MVDTGLADLVGFAFAGVVVVVLCFCEKMNE